MRWSTETLFAIARRIAHLTGGRLDEAYPVIRLRDRHLVFVYVRDVGLVRA